MSRRKAAESFDLRLLKRRFGEVTSVITQKWDVKSVDRADMSR